MLHDLRMRSLRQREFLRGLSKSRDRATAAATRSPPGLGHPLDALWARLNQARRTPQSTIEAVIVGVRERGLKALDESANLERLSRCDETACAQINNRIARIIEQKRCPR